MARRELLFEKYPDLRTLTPEQLASLREKAEPLRQLPDAALVQMIEENAMENAPDFALALIDVLGGGS